MYAILIGIRMFRIPFSFIAGTYKEKNIVTKRVINIRNGLQMLQWIPTDICVR